MADKIRFTKMEGLGNDYIYVDVRNTPLSDPASLSVRLSDRHFGVGADGLVLIGLSPVADFSMRMFNADGSEGRMCGNAARCIGKYVHDKGLSGKSVFTLETLSGIKTIALNLAGDEVESVSVDMGAFCSIDAPDSVQGYDGTGVSMGNPHYVMFVDDAEAVDLLSIGPLIEHDDAFPDGVNAEFASLLPDGSLRMRVWERGSGITLACGTGACATAAAACIKGLSQFGKAITLKMDGGSLTVTVGSDGRVVMTGSAKTVFEGEVQLL